MAAFWMVLWAGEEPCLTALIVALWTMMEMSGEQMAVAVVVQDGGQLATARGGEEQSMVVTVGGGEGQTAKLMAA